MHALYRDHISVLFIYFKYVKAYLGIGFPVSSDTSVPCVPKEQNSQSVNGYFLIDLSSLYSDANMFFLNILLTFDLIFLFLKG